MAKKPSYEELEQRVKELEKEASKRKQAEEALQEERNKLQAIVGAIEYGLTIQDRDYNIIYQNEILSNIFGSLGEKCYRVYEGKDKTCDGCPVQMAWADGKSHTSERKVVMPSGEIAFWENTANPIRDAYGEIVSCLEIARNITERKRAEEALRESEQRFRTVADFTYDWEYWIGPDGGYIYVSPSCERITGYEVHEFLEDPELLERITHLDDRSLVVRHTQMELESDKVHHVEFRIITRSGEECWISHFCQPVKGAGGLILGRRASNRDITDRKRAEEALRESEEKYRRVLEASPDPIVAYDTKGKVIYLNPAFTKVFGWTTEEVLGKRIDYVPEDNWAETQMMIDRVLTGESFSGIKSRRYTKQRDIHDVSISVATYLNFDGNPVGSVHTLRDITERKHLEAQLQQAQKMESIGTLAGGIAHDFNNLLMGVQGNVSLMLIDMDSMHPYYERLKNIEKQVQSGARLTSLLLGYARKGKYEIKPIHLNQLVEEISEAFGRTRKEITIHRELAEDLFAMEADQAQIEQVLLNLCVNAADAMPGSGKLILKTMNVTDKDMKGKLYDPKPGNYVQLTVTDTGIGMDKDTMERIFDPFFTTKEMGRGTGLGLASAYGIIKGHGGYIDVESKKGQGATFSTYLPATEKKVQEAVKTADGIMKATGTVLLVDDEDDVLEVDQELLEAMGYRVLIARDGKEAIEVYEKNRDDIEIVVLDMVMPVMGGGEAYDRMKEINPNVKVLLSSGYSIDGQAKEILKRGCDGFIQKPFSIQKLSQKIREVLE